MAGILNMMSDNLFNKFFPPNFTLETPRVILRPMQPADYDTLLPLSAHQNLFTYFPRDLSAPGELKAWMDEAFAARSNGQRMPFCIFDKDEQQVCGCSSYGNISFYDQRLEIGWSWLSPAFQGTGVNKHAKFALLSYAFEVMQMQRVEIKTDVLNERARAALLKVGMIPEGVLRSHTLMQANRRRDTLYFSILRGEWVERKHAFFAELI